MYLKYLLAAVTVFASPQGSAFQSSNKSEKQFFAVSEHNVLTANCVRKRPLSNGELHEVLLERAKKKDSAFRKHTAEVLGLHFSDESPYFVFLLKTLLTNAPVNDGMQSTYVSQCASVVCVAEEIFGERVGLQLLYMLAQYGFNGSHTRYKNADPWSSEELDVILLALSDLPPHFRQRPAQAMNHPLVHFTRAKNTESRAIANAVIYIYDGWNQFTPGMQRYAVYHELGHNMGFDFGFDSSIDWYRVAQWTDTEFEWKTPRPETKISEYAEDSPHEDFAESFAAYRYNSAALKQLNPKVYKYLRENVYRNIEYTREQACRDKVDN